MGENMDKKFAIHCIGASKFGAGSRDDLGASLVEYALLVALISVVALGGMSLVGQNSSDTMTIAGCRMGDNPGQCCADRGIENPDTVCGPLPTKEL